MARIPTWSLWFDVTRDGRRFIVNAPLDGNSTTPPPLTLLVNWRPPS